MQANYITLSKNLFNKTINILFEKNFYDCHIKILKELFRNYSYRGIAKSYDEEQCFYVCDNKRCLAPKGVDLHIYNTQSTQWLFEMITDIESYIISKLGITVIHGASIRNDSQMVFIIGERNSGKTTLTHFFTNKGWTLVDEDCICYYNDSVIGTGFPLRLRNIIYDNTKILASCVDLDGDNRYLVSVPTSEHEEKVENVTIIFPQYKPDADFSFSEVKKMNLFTMLIKNTRSSADESNCIKDITSIMKKTTQSYSFCYSDCSYVYDFLKGLR